jgi:hypothetical protein
MQHHRDAVPFTDVAAAGMARTVRALYQTRDEPSIPEPALSGARHHVLLAPGTAAPAPEAAEYLRALAQAAHAAAEAQGTGSVLAGQSSESDEFSDVAVFVAHPEGLAPEVSLEPGHVLKELGLSKWGSDVSPPFVRARRIHALLLHFPHHLSYFVTDVSSSSTSPPPTRAPVSRSPCTRSTRPRRPRSRPSSASSQALSPSPSGAGLPRPSSSSVVTMLLLETQPSAVQYPAGQGSSALGSSRERALYEGRAAE